LPNPKKEAIVAELARKLRDYPCVILTTYNGINVADMTELRKRLREAGVQLKVAKNTLARIAAKQAGLESLLPLIEGSTSYVFTDDAVTACRILKEFSEEHPQLTFKGGVIDGKPVEAGVVKSIAGLPPREVLLGMLASALAAPISGLASALMGIPRSLVNVLDAVRRQKEEQKAA